MDVSAKYSVAHSHAIAHGPYVRCSNLANCRFTLVHAASIKIDKIDKMTCHERWR